MGQRPEMYGHNGEIHQKIQTRDRLAQEGLLVQEPEKQDADIGPGWEIRGQRQGRTPAAGSN